uniref:Nucleocapsid n=1 Tax=Avian paramyxovirus 1 TaxID=2560319 RepID=A0A7H1D0C6_NCDV|nr:nucleocapsid protein [avian paramyxovirus 1]UPM06017.1 NP [avian paramyxovirus 1]UPM06023.1 NP [avian paramyxovirus 1]
MSSVFDEYEQLLAAQTRPNGTQGGGEKGSTLKVEIPVFTLNSDDPEDRWNFAVFCLRIAVSEDANKPLRQGALISLLCSHSQVMRNHVALAGKQNEATLAVLEIDGFTNNVPQFNNRSGVSEERAQRFMVIAGSLPRACSNGTPFVTAGVEDDAPEDITDTLERILSIQAQVWVTVAKAMTAYETADESETRRINKYMQQGRVQKRYVLHPVCRSAIQLTIRYSLAVRIFLVSELKRGRNTAGGSSTYYNLVGDVDSYIRNTGLTAFFLTLKYGINTKTSALALSSLTGDIQKMKQLMRLYRMKGENAPYMTLLGDSDQMNFAPAEYAQLYSFAMGMASVLDKGTSKYQFARDFMSTSFWRLGVEYAQAQGSSINEDMAAELKLTPAARRGLAAAAQRVSEEIGTMDVPTQQAGVLTGLSDEGPRVSQGGSNRPQGQPDAGDGETQFLDLMRAVANSMREAQSPAQSTTLPEPPPTPGTSQDNDTDWGY